MNIEDNIFKRYSPDFDKLKEYGFIKTDNNFIIEKLFYNNLFKTVLVIDFNGNISGTVYDLENNDEFLPLRVESNQGAFVGKVRAAYEELLTEIRNNCFTKKYYIFPQSNRITNLIIEKYGNEPEFLWKTTPGTGVFRNPDTKKWYIAILDIDRSKIQPNRTGLVEIALLKLQPDEVQKITKQEHFYQGYHMNKKYWITIILDDTVLDEKIMELIEKSHNLTKKK
ncbi:MmcQ/YjbR family DNA-binding protein [Oxalobacter aliiformigenes]|uniref:MmcQ/YjbR family DNA-binding protein n=1 Tax=Oxalobacter aliiformigenes TaxID=2946593 RepID=UPI0022B07237|nr:MmcQ/YjbR family DNA-binding protein [Oxalobacter aliiformigenes]MCZ4064740.1 MmcQ/YjbR family DNA-binding protein [Oxalobacter aliiformigenes]WAV99970.1 MmcQ/YjbR family DNA-binding protein [Oxalobacter aliiformigenes]